MSRSDGATTDPRKPRAGQVPPDGRGGSARGALPLAAAGLLLALGVVAVQSSKGSAAAEIALHVALLSVVLLVSALGVAERGRTFGGFAARVGAGALAGGAALALARASGLDGVPLAVPLEVTLKTVGVVLVGFTLGSRTFRSGADPGATLRSTFDSVSDPIVVTDAGCRIVEVNWFAELRFEEPLVGRLACETSYFRRDTCEGCPVAECFDRGSARFFTVRDEERRPRYELATIPVPDASGRIEGVVQHVTDVSARSIGEERVRFLGEVVAAVDHGVVGLDPAGRVTAINPSACRLLGVAEDATIGRDPLEFLRLGASDARRLRGAIRRRESSRLEVDLGPEDDPRRIVATVDPILDDLAEPIGAALLLRDVTDRRAAEERLRQAERLSSLGTFVSGLAHELNHPIAAVCAAIERHEHGDADAATAWEEIRGQADRCRRVISGLLRFARRTAPARREEDLGRIARGVVDLVERALRRDRITLALTDPGGVVASVDAHQIEQVVLNLVTNARDALRSVERGGRIDVRLAIEGDEAIVEVSDDGPGLPGGDAERLFEPYVTTKAEGAGTGLGLALARGLAADHGGSLVVAAREPRGARFTLRLPRGTGEAAREEEAAATAAPADEGAPRAREAVLVVEDEAGIAEYLRFCLQTDGFEVEVTRGIEEARACLLGARAWEHVVSDVALEDGRGPDLYREVVGLRPELKGRFVFVTGDSFSDEDLLTRDGNRVVFKPFGREELLAAVTSTAPSR
ncbi:MAG: ATP-binding protein [Planctomycetota bacterium JB042]